MPNRHTYSCQDISDQDVEAVVRTLKGPYLTQGPMTDLFESKVADYTGAQFAISFNSATSALHGALVALGISQSDVIWTTPITFVATANAAIYCGASIDFIDIDPETLNISVAALTQKLALADKLNRLPTAIILVHFAGSPVNPEAIQALAIKYGFKIVEDGSHAFGSSYGQHMIGSCRDSDLCIFSFHAVKPITSGEGGAVTTNNPAVARRLKQFRSHGITREPEDFRHTEMSKEPWYYEQVSLGWNYRLSDIHAALGSSQIDSSDSKCRIRNRLVSWYRERLKQLPVRLQQIPDKARSAYHIMVVLFENKATRNLVRRYLHNHNIGTNLHYIPVYKHPFYADMFESDYSLPNAEQYYDQALTIPLHTKLDANDVSFICDRIEEALNHDQL